MGVKINLIRKKRKEMEYSEEYMASVLNITQAQYSRLENGRSGWDVNKVKIVCDTLKIDPLDVLDLNDNQAFFYCNQSGNIENIHNNCDAKQLNDFYIAQIEELKKDKAFLQRQIAVLEERIIVLESQMDNRRNALNL